MSSDADINQRADQAVARIEQRLTELADSLRAASPDAYADLMNRIADCRRRIQDGDGLTALRLLEPMDLEITRLTMAGRRPPPPLPTMPVPSVRSAPPPPIEMTAAARISDAAGSRRSMRPPTVPEIITRSAHDSARRATTAVNETPDVLIERAFQSLKDNAELLREFGAVDIFALKDRISSVKASYDAAPEASEALVRRTCAEVFAEADAARARAAEVDQLKRRAQDIYRLSLEHKERLGVRFLTIQSALEKFADAIERHDCKTGKRLLEEASSRFDLARRTTQIVIKK